MIESYQCFQKNFQIKYVPFKTKEEKLTFSAVFNFNKKGDIIESWFGRTIIESDYRFSYQEAQEIIETKSDKIPKEISLKNNEYTVDKKNIVDAILTLDKIAKQKRKERENKGSINFNKKEVSFKLNEDKDPVEIIFKESKDANKLIEEFMLIANKKVAELFTEIKNKNIFTEYTMSQT